VAGSNKLSDRSSQADVGPMLASPSRDVVLTPKAFNDLVRVNKWVNDTIKPMTDLD